MCEPTEFVLWIDRGEVIPVKANEQPWDWDGNVPDWLQTGAGLVADFTANPKLDLFAELLDYTDLVAPVLLEDTVPPDAQGAELRLEAFEADGRWLVEPLAPLLPSRAPDPRASSWTATVGAMELVEVPAGEFWMGASKEPGARNHDPDASSDEAPVHRVRIATDYWIGTHPVTNEQYRAFVDATGHRPAESQAGFDAPRQPVTGVDWHDAAAFCAWMTNQLAPGWVAALPTEAMWERAARGSDARRYPWGDEPPTAARAAFDGTSLPEVGGRPAGAGPFGTHDQAGLVWEWCRDAYRPYPSVSTVVDHHVDTVDSAASRVFRSGSWVDHARDVRAACRSIRHPDSRYRLRGFRVVVFPEHGPRS